MPVRAVAWCALALVLASGCSQVASPPSTQEAGTTAPALETRLPALAPADACPSAWTSLGFGGCPDGRMQGTAGAHVLPVASEHRRLFPVLTPGGDFPCADTAHCHPVANRTTYRLSGGYPSPRYLLRIDRIDDRGDAYVADVLLMATCSPLHVNMQPHDAAILVGSDKPLRIQAALAGLDGCTPPWPAGSTIRRAALDTNATLPAGGPNVALCWGIDRAALAETDANVTWADALGVVGDLRLGVGRQEVAGGSPLALEAVDTPAGATVSVSRDGPAGLPVELHVQIAVTYADIEDARLDEACPL